MLRIGLVVDSSCDLSMAQIEDYGVRVLPSILEFEGKSCVDDRGPDSTMAYYRGFIADKAVAGRSVACSAAEIQEIFLRELVLDFERVLVISACAELSETFQRATEASYAILQGYRARREAGRQRGSFALRVLDSRSVCAGEAVLAGRALSLLFDERQPFEKTRRRIREETGRIRCLLVPGDPWYLRHRGLDGEGAGLGRGDYALARMTNFRPVLEVVGGQRRTVARARGFQAACATAMQRARDAIRQGLGAPAVALSFGGDPRVIREMPAYLDLEAQAVAAHIDIHLAVMSAMMGVRFGPGAFSIAWLGKAPSLQAVERASPPASDRAAGQ